MGLTGNLFGAFAGVASFTLLASIVAFLSYGHIGRSLQKIQLEGIPAISHALILARQAADLSASSSTLFAAKNEAALDAAISRFDSIRGEMSATLDVLESSSVARSGVENLKNNVVNLERSANRLSNSTSMRLIATDQRKNLAAGIIAAHRALVEQLAPLVDDAEFNLVMGLQSLAETQDHGATARSLADSEASDIRALADLRAESNMALGILTEVSLAPNLDALPPLRDRLTASTLKIKAAVNHLGGTQKLRELNTALDKLLAYGNEGAGIFEARRAELELDAKGWMLAAENQNRAINLVANVQDFVRLAQSISLEAVSASQEAIEQSQNALILLVIMSLVGAIAITWVHIGHGLLRRLGNLNRAILALAGGNLDVAIPHEGHDELSHIATAIEVFKSNAIQARDLEADKEKGRIEDLKRREASFKLLFKSNPVPMWVYDRQSLRFLAVNEAATQHYGYSRDQFLAMTILDIRPVEDREATAKIAKATLNATHHDDRTWRHFKANGEQMDVAIYSKSLIYENKEASLVAVIDMTERQRAEARIAHMAHHDALTNLANRVLFRQRLEEALARVRREGHSLAVLCLDLDHFKSINDTLGHPTGDALLRAVATRLSNCLRETDTFARLGGDEFAIIQDMISGPEEAGDLATRLLELLGAPYQLDGHEIIISASFGIAIALNDGADPDVLLKNADMALYRSKGEGRDTYRFFEPEMDARLQARHVLELDLRAALIRQEFELYFQPLIDLESNKLTGFEALLRWHHPQRGLVAPAEFIPLAEEIGLIVALGEWVLRQACTEALNWPDDITVAVNLSPVQFTSHNLLHAVVLALASSGLSPHRLELEITESVLLQKNENNLAVLHQLRELGVRIAMDDFGTGYSSLSYLRSFPFDKIKIDRSFVKEMTESAESAAIVRAVSSLAHGLNIMTTAEGVETQEQLDCLRIEGCTQGQGYLFSRAMPAEDIAEFLKANSLQAKVAA